MQQQKYLICPKYFGMIQKWPFFKNHVQTVLDKVSCQKCSIKLWNYVLLPYRFMQQQKYLIWSKYFGMKQKWPFFRNHVQKVLAQNVAFNHQRESIAYQNLIFSLSCSLGLKAFQSFYEAICMLAQMFFKRSDIKYWTLK